MGDTYRTTLSDGTVPEGDRAFCVHCDDKGPSCRSRRLDATGTHRADCDCMCHTLPRRSNCLCYDHEGQAVGCCGDGCCDCKCHNEEWVEEQRQLKAEHAAEDAEWTRVEVERLAKEGVAAWEKEAFQLVISGQTSYARDYLLKRWAKRSWAYGEAAEPTETGDEFITRIRLTPWGAAYYREGLQGIGDLL